MSDKGDGIEQYLSTYRRTETQELVEVTDDNLMVLARILGGTISFTVPSGTPEVRLDHRRFIVGDLIDKDGYPHRSYNWIPAETGELINGGDLR